MLTASALSMTAQKATCSCGKQPALSCTCDKAATENVKPTGSTCACGLRPAGACTCDKTGVTGGSNSANEIDFTTKK